MSLKFNVFTGCLDNIGMTSDEKLDYWLCDGSSTATGDWDLGVHSLTAGEGYFGFNSVPWVDLFGGDGAANVQPPDGSTASLKIGGMEYSKDFQYGVSYMVQREVGNFYDSHGNPAAYGSILAFYSNTDNGRSSINLGFGEYFTAIAWEQVGMFGGWYGATTPDNNAWGLWNETGNAKFGVNYPYDGYSVVQAGGTLSAYGSIQVRADTNYGEYGPSFDFNASASGGGYWRMVSTANNDAIGPGKFLINRGGVGGIAFTSPQKTGWLGGWLENCAWTFGAYEDDGTGSILQVHGGQSVGNVGAGNYSQFEADGTLHFNGTATVFGDWQFPISLKSTGAGKPTLATFTGNISQYTMAVNDVADFNCSEFIHEWKEGSTIELHVHWATGGLNDATVRGVKWEIEYTWANIQSAGGTIVFPAATTVSAESSIAANEAAKTHKYTSVVSFTPTGGKVGAQLLLSLKRIASVTNTAPANNPWILGVGVHGEKDTVGSRTISSK